MSKRFSAANTLLREVKRTRKGRTAKLTFPLTKSVSKQLGWPELPEGTKGWSPEDSELAATLIELTPNNEELRAAAMTLDATGLGDFSVMHKEKKKGKDSVKSHEVIVEVSCTATFQDPLGAAKLEAYLQGAARSKMIVAYTPQPTQDELPGTRVDMSGGEDQLPFATEEQRAAVSEIETAVEEAKAKRGRPRKDVQ